MTRFYRTIGYNEQNFESQMSNTIQPGYNEPRLYNEQIWSVHS